MIKFSISQISKFMIIIKIL